MNNSKSNASANDNEDGLRYNFKMTMDLQPLDDLIMAETPEDYEYIKGCLNDKYYDMIQRIIKDPKAKDNMLLKLLKQNSYATSKSIANKITKEKEREFIKE